MKASKMICALSLILAAGVFTGCTNEETAEEDRLYEQGIDGSEIKNQDTRVFEVEIKELDYEAIDGSEIKNQDT